MSGMIVIPGYRVAEFLSTHSKLGIYRGYRNNDNLPVLFKVPMEGPSHKESLWKLKHEYRILQSLESHAVETIIELVNHNRETVMITEDFGGVPLSLLMKMKGLSLKEMLFLAVRMASCLKEIHQHGIIHKDVNPDHILVHPETYEVKLGSFGLATKSHQEYQSVMNPKEWKGNLRYVSPEQTGRMNRTVDYRSDIYSFGVTLYELLTGKLPFLTSDMLELIHAHMARKPLAPSSVKPSVPEILSDIVMKCLSKNTEDRYFSMSGLLADLQRCYDQLEQNGLITPFPLALEDRADHLRIPERLYGREQEIQMLIDAFEQVTNGATRMVLLSGSAGVGKSALVLEAQKAFLRGRGRFVSGKFEQYNQAVPYSALIQIFQDLIKQLLAGHERELLAWREMILDAVQGLGQVIVDVIPQLEAVIGKQPAVPELPAAEAKNRFQWVMQRFIRIWARPEHPLVLFLDDLQWADSSSLFLIRELIADRQISHFLLICAYREHDGSMMNPLIAILTETGIKGRILRQLTLLPLREHEFNALVADTLHSDTEMTKPLVTIIMQKTAGNPFYVREFIKTLYDRNLVWYGREERNWQWDLAEIEKLGTTENVADLLVEKMRRLPVSTQQQLAYAACLGNSFLLHLIAKSRNQTESEAIQHISPAIEEGLIYPIEGAEYLTYAALVEEEVASQMRIRFRFVHDRIQQAAYSLLEEAERGQTHVKLGRMMWEMSQGSESGSLFEICDHMYRGKEILEDQAERMHVAHCHLLAGQKAKSSAAFESALQYFQRGLELVGEEGWQHNHDLTMELCALSAETTYLCNQLDEAKQLFERGMQHAKTDRERVRILEMEIRMYTRLAEFPRVMEIASEALGLLGVPIPKKPGKLDIIKEMFHIKRRLKGRKIDELLYLPDVPDENYQMAMSIISYAGPSAYYVNLNWFALTILRALHLSLVHGNAVASANGYTGYGIVQAAQFGKYREAYEFGQLACRVADSFADPIAMTKAYGAFALLINHWCEHARTNIPLLKKAIQLGLDGGGNIYAAYNAHGLLEAMLYCGVPVEELEQQIEEYSDMIQQIKVVDHDDRLLLLRQALHTFTRWTDDERTAFCQDGFDEVTYVSNLQKEGNSYKRYMYHYYKSMVHLMYGNHLEAAELLAEAEQWMDSVSGQVLVSQHVFMQTLALTGLYENANRQEKSKYGKKITANIKKMKVWAKECPENFQHKWLLMHAEWLRVTEHKQEAGPFYEQAVQLAKKDVFLQNEAMANELAAQHYLALGMETIAKAYMTEAHEVYMLWGAVAKAREIGERYPYLLQRVRSLGASAEIATTDQTADLVDLMSVIKASQTIASELRLEMLLATMLRTVMSNAGAEKGILLLKKDGDWLIEAAGSVDLDVEIMQSVPYEHSGMLSVAVVNYTIRTEEMLVLHNASVEGVFFRDTYIAKHQPKSILCSPLWQQGKMIGVIYLENNETTHVFNEKRSEPLRLIFSQIAIFIENARLYHQLEQWNQSLEKIVTERTNEIQALLQANKNLLNNAGQGFLSFSKNLLVHSEYSRECLRIFGRELAGISVAELLYPDRPEDRVFIESLLEKYFEAKDQGQKELYLSLFPTEVQINQMPLKLACKPIYEDRRDSPEGLMLILTDMSEQQALKSKMEREWQRLNMVVTVAISLPLFQKVLRAFNAFFEEGWKQILGGAMAESEKLFKLVAQIHQFKGDFSQLHLIHTPQKLHDLESWLIQWAKSEERLSDEDVRAQQSFAEVQAAMQQDLSIMQHKLGVGFLDHNEHVHTIAKERWESFEHEITSLVQGEAQQELLHRIRKLRYRPMKDMLSRYEDYVSALAIRLNKTIDPVEWDAEEVLVDTERFENFARSLVHVFNNAIDHGMEEEQERLACGKERSGKIQCRIWQEDTSLCVTIRDDGRGGDREKLKLALAEDVTVQEHASLVSGRGIGLSIVKQEVEQLGGTLQVHTQKGEGTRFTFRIPLEEIR
ncbi:AAA family ATPase [Brevibacillus sp. HB1.3]|uniref:AAA family ATPase n=1 Tax=Brevibacillus sp. HB1.3 TaxID=2738842 RepID=UPI0015579028|nr:AAA family ATPase [Brevibacillus sp. HB1.3]NQF13591.1 AAA family ATPase [Brevibacillus sp. HB1.3]